MKTTLLKSILLGSVMTILFITGFAQVPDPGPSPDGDQDNSIAFRVSLTGISAFRTADQNVSLSRISANKINIADYTPEKSTTGNRFTAISIVPSSRNNGVTAVDTLPDTHNYGDFTYSLIKVKDTNDAF